MARQGKADMTAQVECDETRTDAVMPQQARMLSSETWPRSSLNEELGDVTSLNPVYEPGMRESYLCKCLIHKGNLSTLRRTCKAM